MFTGSLARPVQICGFEYLVPRTDISPLPVATDSLCESFRIMEEAVVPVLQICSNLWKCDYRFLWEGTSRLPPGKNIQEARLLVSHGILIAPSPSKAEQRFRDAGQSQLTAPSVLSTQPMDVLELEVWSKRHHLFL